MAIALLQFRTLFRQCKEEPNNSDAEYNFKDQVIFQQGIQQNAQVSASPKLTYQ